MRSTATVPTRAASRSTPRSWPADQAAAYKALCAKASWTTNGARSIAARALRRPARRPQGTRRCRRRRPGRASRQRRCDVRRGAAGHAQGNQRRAPATATTEITGEGLRPCAVRACRTRRRPTSAIRRGAVIRVVKTPKGTWEITQLPEVEGAFIALDPRDGAVKAMVGGFDFDKNKFNHVTQAWRQPGSSFKPFIYSAALEKGFTPGTIVNDAPLFFDAGTHRRPAVGAEELRRQFRRSRCRCGARSPSRRTWCRSACCSRSARASRRTGSATSDSSAEKHPAYLPMALGAGSVTPMQMAAAYGGVRQRRLSRQPLARDPHHRPQGQGAGRGRAAAARRERARDLAAQCVRHGFAAAGSVVTRRHRPQGPPR
jgi:hypothetical protein